MAAPQLPTDLQQAVESKPFWYHKIELPGGITTPGWAPLAAEAYRIPEDMTGMRVLDIGAWDGFWTFEALRRGAKEVVAIDDFSDYLGMLGNEDRRAWENFDLCRDALGYPASQAQRIEMSVYDVNEARLGKFDAVFFFGTLYHLRYPLLAMDLISSVCDNALFVETAICDDYSPYRGGFGHGYPGGHAVVEFYPNTEYGNNPTNWWAPTLGALGLMTMAAGWTDIEVWKLVDNPTELAHCRGFARAFKGEKLPG
jgi:tRNA (mo5U34)-methyltransferase